MYDVTIQDHSVVKYNVAILHVVYVIIGKVLEVCMMSQYMIIQ